MKLGFVSLSYTLVAATNILRCTSLSGNNFILGGKYKSIPRIQIRDLYGRAVQILFPEGDVWLRHQFVKRTAEPLAPSGFDLYDVCYKSWWRSHLPLRASICIRDQFVKGYDLYDVWLRHQLP